MPPRRPKSTLFPYTTLFRSQNWEVQKPLCVHPGYSISVPAESLSPSPGGEFRYLLIRDPESWKHNPSTRDRPDRAVRSEEHTSELQSRGHLVCRLLLEKKKQ